MKRKQVKIRNWHAVSAWARKAGPMQDKRKKKPKHKGRDKWDQ